MHLEEVSPATAPGLERGRQLSSGSLGSDHRPSSLTSLDKSPFLRSRNYPNDVNDDDDDGHDQGLDRIAGGSKEVVVVGVEEEEDLIRRFNESTSLTFVPRSVAKRKMVGKRGAMEM